MWRAAACRRHAVPVPSQRRAQALLFGFGKILEVVLGARGANWQAPWPAIACILCGWVEEGGGARCTLHTVMHRKGTMIAIALHASTRVG